MTIQARIDANRRNATHSTGPRSATGKATASQNHLMFGLYTREDFVKPEERGEYTAFQTALHAELNPANLIEEAVASEIFGSAWRLRRCARAEALLGDFDPANHRARDPERAPLRSPRPPFRTMPLRSGQKYKRCCGQNSAQVLLHAA